MFGTLQFHGFLLLLFPACSISTVTRTCIEKEDVVVVFEEPTYDFNVTKFHSFFGKLISNINECLQLSIHIVDGSLVYPLLQFNENSRSYEDMRRKINIYEQSTTPIARQNSTKKLLLKELLKVENNLFFGSRSARTTHRKIAVVLTRQREEAVQLERGFGELVEDNFDVIAIGVGLGQTENLMRMTYDVKKTRRYFSIDEWLLSETFTKSFGLKTQQNEGVVGVIEAASLMATDIGFPGVAIEEEEEYKYVGTSLDECRYAVDIAFLIDSSKSIQYDYKKLLHFVREIARSFGVSEKGARAGAILFSDFRNYTKLYIKLDQFATTKDFNRAIFNSPFLGFRTRIDLAFRMTEEELFTIEGGARPNVRQAIFLITDGRQNPRRFEKDVYDPVEASRLMYERGISIFAVGIGQIINRTELESITRHKDRVFYESNFDALLEKKFIKNVSTIICKKAKAGKKQPPRSKLVSTTTTQATTTTPVPTTTLLRNLTNSTKSSNCTKDINGRCCSIRDVYINIFNGGTGAKYVLQGASIAHNSGSLITTSNPEKNDHTEIDITKKLSNEEIIRTLKKNLPFDSNLIDIIDKKLRGEENLIVKRRRRAIENDDNILERAATFGCSKFIEVLKTKTYLQKFDNVTLFCPIDGSLQGINYELVTSDDFINNHVTKKIGNSVFQAIHGNDRVLVLKNKITWTANEIPVLFKVILEKGWELYVLKGPLYREYEPIDNELVKRSDISLFNNLWLSSKLNFQNLHSSVESLCFQENFCFKISEELQNHLRDISTARQFTVIAPVDKRLKSEIKINETATIQKEKARDIIKSFIYVGKVRANIATPNILTNDLTNEANLSHFYWNTIGLLQIQDSKGSIYTVKNIINVKNGVLYVVE